MKKLKIPIVTFCSLFLLSAKCDRLPNPDEPTADDLVKSIILNINPLRANDYQLIHIEHNKKRPYVLLAKIEAEPYTVDTCKLKSMTFRVQSLRKKKNYYYVRSVNKTPGTRKFDLELEVNIDRVKNISNDYITTYNESSENIITCDVDKPCEITVPFNGMKIHNNMLVDYHLNNTNSLETFINEFKVSEVDETEDADFCCGAICKTYLTF